MDDETIRLYVGINETKWNHHPVAPGQYACIAPVYGRTERTRKKNSVRVPTNTVVLSDSGAFSDGPNSRLPIPDALVRQIKHASQYKYDDCLDAFASYDLLIDEKWHEGIRSKQRWSEQDAWDAVDETVAAARYLSSQRHLIPCESLVISAQGVTPEQYLECVQRIAPTFNDGDILGLGGWCIMGIRKKLIHSFRPTIRMVVPFAAQFTKRIHIWGVLYAPALGNLLWLCDQYGIKLSTDSTGPTVRPARGVWGYMGWVDKTYKRPPVEIRGLERARHVQAVKSWLSNFRGLEFYKEPK